jgi:hypothetical protein
MAAPRPVYGEAGEGVVNELVPPLEWVRAVKSGDLSMEVYRDRYERLLGNTPSAHYGPKFLSAHEHDAPWGTVVVVADGDTLLCCCSRAAAAAERCHRTWAARALVKAGWTVVLDGVTL